MGVGADTRSAYFYQSCNNPRKCLDFRMFLRNAGPSELRKVHGNFLHPSCLFQLLFYQCSIICLEGELAMLILPGGVSAYRWEVRSWVREEGGREAGVRLQVGLCKPEERRQLTALFPP